MASIRRNRRSRVRTNGLSGAQSQILRHGYVMLPERGPDAVGFASQEEHKTAWWKHRAELLRESRPGARPAAYYSIELGIADSQIANWFDEIRILLQHDLITPEESTAIEAHHDELSPRAPVDVEFYFADSVEGLRHVLGNDHYAFRNHIEKMQVCARWHVWRGRPAIAEVYKRRAELAQRLSSGEA